MADPLALLARDDFKAGDLGHATADGVSQMRGGFVPDDGVVVRAVENVRAGETGKFEELRQNPK